MRTLIDDEGIFAEFDETCSTLEACCSLISNCAERCWLANKDEQQQYTVTKASITEQLEDISERGSTRWASALHHERIMEELKKDKERLIEQESDAKMQLTRTQQAIQRARERAAAAAAQTKTDAQRQLDLMVEITQLEQWLAPYHKTLGISIRQGEGTDMPIVFTNIHEMDVTREYTIGIGVQPRTDGGKDMYKVAHCNPPVKNVQQLIDELNQTRSLKQFVYDIRKEFRKHAMEELNGPTRSLNFVALTRSCMKATAGDEELNNDPSSTAVESGDLVT